MRSSGTFNSFKVKLNKIIKLSKYSIKHQLMNELKLDKYRSLYVGRGLNGYVIVYSNTYKGIVAPFTKAMSMQMFKQEFEYFFPTLELAEQTLQEIKKFIKSKKS